MFLLTEATLFFLDLAFNTRTCDGKASLNSVVQAWVDGVAAATEDSADRADTTMDAGPSSTSYALPLIRSSTTVSQTSPTSDSRDVASASTPHNVPVSSEASFPADNLRRGFVRAVDENEGAGEIAMNHDGEAFMGTSGMGVEGPRVVKRKVDDTEIVSNMGPGGSGDDILEGPAPEDTSRVAKMVNSTASKRGRTHTPSTSPTSPPQKKVKYEGASARPLSASPDLTVGCISAACMPEQQDVRSRRVDNEGYIVEAIKERSEYTNRDLPVACDQRWSHSFISTAILWYSVQKNIWNVPKEELASALQRIFSVVYPGVKYRVTPAGSVFAVTLQRIHAWRGSFGSSALAMMLHFFASLDADDDIHHVAELLATDRRFLRRDPDVSTPTEMFRSAFLIMLIAITHLGDIAAFVDVPGWDTRAMAAGKGGEGVIAIASAALERAVTFFCDGTLDVDHVLADIASHPHPTAVRALPKTVLDTPAFSSAHWSGRTEAYREAVRKRGTVFVRGTFAAAQRRRVAGVEAEADASVSGPVLPDPRALL